MFSLLWIITVILQFESTSNILKTFLKITRRHLVASYFETSGRQKIVQRKQGSLHCREFLTPFNEHATLITVLLICHFIRISPHFCIWKIILIKVWVPKYQTDVLPTVSDIICRRFIAEEQTVLCLRFRQLKIKMKMRMTRPDAVKMKSDISAACTVRL